jgi:hypothetical protein
MDAMLNNTFGTSQQRLAAFCVATLTDEGGLRTQDLLLGLQPTTGFVQFVPDPINEPFVLANGIWAANPGSYVLSPHIACCTGMTSDWRRPDTPFESHHSQYIFFMTSAGELLALELTDDPANPRRWINLTVDMQAAGIMAIDWKETITACGSGLWRQPDELELAAPMVVVHAQHPGWMISAYYNRYSKSWEFREFPLVRDPSDPKPIPPAVPTPSLSGLQVVGAKPGPKPPPAKGDPSIPVGGGLQLLFLPPVTLPPPNGMEFGHPPKVTVGDALLVIGSDGHLYMTRFLRVDTPHLQPDGTWANDHIAFYWSFNWGFAYFPGYFDNPMDNTVVDAKTPSLSAYKVATDARLTAVVRAQDPPTGVFAAWYCMIDTRRSTRPIRTTQVLAPTWE